MKEKNFGQRPHDHSDMRDWFAKMGTLLKQSNTWEGTSYCTVDDAHRRGMRGRKGLNETSGVFVPRDGFKLDRQIWRR